MSRSSLHIRVSSHRVGTPRCARSTLISTCALLLVAACSGQQTTTFGAPSAVGGFAAPVLPAAGRAGAAATPPVAGAGQAAPPIAQSSPGATAANAGAGALAGAGGSMAQPAHMHDDCTEPTPPALEDSMTTSEPESWMSSRGRVDLLLPKPVQSWMHARLMNEGHDGWHGVRRCDLVRAGPGLPRSPALKLCEMTELKPAEQECAGPEDGYEFLLTHRHMLNVMRQAFPTHKELFAGFPKFPFAATDVPEAWRSRFGNGWSPQIVESAKQLDDIEHQLDRFPTEGALGQFIQCGGMASGLSAVHGALHSKWVVNGSPAMLGDTATNLDNYMFWKLHGWIDDVWTRYRTAKGLREDDPKHVAALVGQCREMHMLGNLLGPATATPGAMDPLPDEAGTFHEQVRPILEDNCAGCHSGGSPEGGLFLGGHVSSASIVTNLLNVQTSRGGQFKRVVPRNAMQSWLYLKASGKAASAGCTGMCNSQVMPPTGMVTLTAAELSTIERWINDGAPAPTMR